MKKLLAKEIDPPFKPPPFTMEVSGERVQLEMLESIIGQEVQKKVEENEEEFDNFGFRVS